MTKLFGVPIDQLVAVMVGIFLLGLIVLVVMALRNRVAFRLAVRNIPRRRTQTSPHRRRASCWPPSSSPRPSPPATR